jgi:hypothetical protein
MKFRATALNKEGFTFSFIFCNPNWNGAREIAERELEKLVNNDKLHTSNGPWIVKSFDVTA